MSGRDQKTLCGSQSPFEGTFGYRSEYQNGNGAQNRNGFDLGSFVKDTAVGFVMGGLTSATFYGAGKGVEALQNSVRSVYKSGKTSDLSMEQMPSLSPQTYTADLENVTGKGAEARNRAIMAIIKEDFPDLNLTFIPEYSPYIRTGIAQRNTGTQIGKRMFSSRADLRDTIIHEELHHRWWKRGIIDHHPMNSAKEEMFYKTIAAYKKMRGWD